MSPWSSGGEIRLAGGRAPAVRRRAHAGTVGGAAMRLAVRSSGAAVVLAAAVLAAAAGRAAAFAVDSGHEVIGQRREGVTSADRSWFIAVTILGAMVSGARARGGA
jgi:hypothetical protein